jgi:hypothetical protein
MRYIVNLVNVTLHNTHNNLFCRFKLDLWGFICKHTSGIWWKETASIACTSGQSDRHYERIIRLTILTDLF